MGFKDDYGDAVVKKYISPFYMHFVGLGFIDTMDDDGIEKFIKDIHRVANEIDENLLTAMLKAEWRVRIVANIFCAIRKKSEMTDIIGTMLFEYPWVNSFVSECASLLSFYTPQSLHYLRKFIYACPRADYVWARAFACFIPADEEIPDLKNKIPYFLNSNYTPLYSCSDERTSELVNRISFTLNLIFKE